MRRILLMIAALAALLPITGAIRSYWERNGGLPVFGYPIGEQHTETIERRTRYSASVQWKPWHNDDHR